jgi:hypothetical protein
MTENSRNWATLGPLCPGRNIWDIKGSDTWLVSSQCTVSIKKLYSRTKTAKDENCNNIYEASLCPLILFAMRYLASVLKAYSGQPNIGYVGFRSGEKVTCFPGVYFLSKQCHLHFSALVQGHTLLPPNMQWLNLWWILYYSSTNMEPWTWNPCLISCYVVDC